NSLSIIIMRTPRQTSERRPSRSDPLRGTRKRTRAAPNPAGPIDVDGCGDPEKQDHIKDVRLFQRKTDDSQAMPPLIVVRNSHNPSPYLATFAGCWKKASLVWQE